MDLWNPEHLLPLAPDDEYDSESKQIAGKLKINDTVDEVASVIAGVCSAAFSGKYDAEYCQEVAEAIVRDLERKFSTAQNK